ncbi:MAG: Grx4 family monothiol glutaredoxin [Planctomycetota bacterium]|nr:MAG: Grx4 family monothiol glutaredoxin [Planctomycetota bacterium]
MSEIRQALEQAIEDNKICLFVKGTKEMPRCGFSASVIEIFKQLDVPFTCVDILADPRLRPELVSISQWPTTPQIFLNGEFIGGGDIIREMFANGELRPMVEQALAS